MAATISVPVNTMLADLDESLRALVRRELQRRGFDGVNVVFDAPTREWAAALSAPTVAMFLYDLREAEAERRATWTEQRGNGRAWQARPPLMIDCSYAVTAWTRAVEDEHRLLSQVLTILYAYTVIPGELLTNGLTEAGPVRSRTGRSRENGSPEFWTALGGQYKASVNYTVTLPCPAGTIAERGPAVQTQTVTTRLLDSPAEGETRFRTTGTVHDASGEPVADAWVVVHGPGAWAATGADGRFNVEAPAGRHRCTVRARDGLEAEGELVVPGPGLDLVVGVRAA